MPSTTHLTSVSHENFTPNLSLLKAFTQKMMLDANRKSKTPPREIATFPQHLILLCIRLLPFPLGIHGLDTGVWPLCQASALHLHDQQKHRGGSSQAGPWMWKSHWKREKHKGDCAFHALPLKSLISQDNCFKQLKWTKLYKYLLLKHGGLWVLCGSLFQRKEDKFAVADSPGDSALMPGWGPEGHLPLKRQVWAKPKSSPCLFPPLAFQSDFSSRGNARANTTF